MGSEGKSARDVYREIIYENIEYDILCQNNQLDREMLTEIAELIVDTVCSARKTIRIAGDDFPAEVVKSRFMKLDSSHVQYVMDCISMTEAGFKEINTATTVYDTASSLLRGYSNLTMRITYACTVNSDAATVYGDSCNPNEVKLTWKRTNTEYYDTLNDDCHVYTYGVDLTKQFSDDAGNFDHVKFLFHNTTDGYYVIAQRNDSEGVYYVTGHTTQESEATQFSPMSGSVNTGKVIVKGLEDDTYVITEIETDDGYKLLKEDITVEITSAPGSDICPICETSLLTASAKVNGSDVRMNEDNSSVHAIVPLTVTNTRGYDLPKTGGNGTRMLYIAGGLTLIAALGAVALAFGKKKRHA